MFWNLVQVLDRTEEQKDSVELEQLAKMPRRDVESLRRMDLIEGGRVVEESRASVPAVVDRKVDLLNMFGV
jgi:hypothetical protein